MKTLGTLLVFILCGFTATSFAATLVVTKTADTNDGACDADCSLGYYRFAGIPSGAYNVSVFHKSYLFDSPVAVIIDGNRNDLNFVSQ